MKFGYKVANLNASITNLYREVTKQFNEVSRRNSKGVHFWQQAQRLRTKVTQQRTQVL